MVVMEHWVSMSPHMHAKSKQQQAQTELGTLQQNVAAGLTIDNLPLFFPPIIISFKMVEGSASSIRVIIILSFNDLV